MAQGWFERWCALLGSTTLDIPVGDLLREMGLLKVPKIPRNDFEARIYSNGVGLVFHDAEMYPNHPGGGGSGVGILKTVNLFAKSDDNLYEGQLPYGLERSDGRSEVVRKLGAPNERNIDSNYDSWTRGKQELRVKYSGAEDDAPILAMSATVDLTSQGS